MKKCIALFLLSIFSHFLIFRLNSDSDLESLISGDNVDHKRQPLYSIVSSPYVVFFATGSRKSFSFFISFQTWHFEELVLASHTITLFQFFKRMCSSRETG